MFSECCELGNLLIVDDGYLLAIHHMQCVSYQDYINNKSYIKLGEIQKMAPAQLTAKCATNYQVKSINYTVLIQTTLKLLVEQTSVGFFKQEGL